MNNPQPGERVYWFHKSWGKVAVVKPFRPFGKDVGETIIRTDEGVTFIARNQDLHK